MFEKMRCYKISNWHAFSNTKVLYSVCYNGLQSLLYGGPVQVVSKLTFFCFLLKLRNVLKQNKNKKMFLLTIKKFLKP